MKKVLIYDPYLDTLGGGERYVLTLAQTLLREEWEVKIAWEDPDILSKAKDKFRLKIDGMEIIDRNIFSEKFVHKWSQLKNFDLLFWVSDGSLPMVFGPKKTWVHFQVPFMNVEGDSFKNQTKLKMVSKLVCNSQFTANVIRSEFGKECQVLYPPVATDLFKPGVKTNTILYVGRFSRLMQDKAHAELIATFKNFSGVKSNDYRLVLAGSTETSEAAYLNWLRNEAEDYPIEIVPDPSFEELQKLYAEAKFFWGLAGFNADEETQPERCEHFGMSVVEAMAAGCIPILLNKGGYKEIVEDGQSGYLISRIDQMISITTNLINQISLTEITQKAMARANFFSETRFSRQVISWL